MDAADNPKRSRMLVTQFKQSQIYRDFAQAFRDATGLPLSLRPVESFDLHHANDPRQNPFCALMAKSNHSCSACLQLQREVEQQAQREPATLKCFAGLYDSAVPIRVGENVLAFLQTGQVFFQKPLPGQFDRVARQLAKWGVEIDIKPVAAAYHQSRVVPKKQYDAILRLLAVFAQHLAAISNRLMVQEEHAESPVITRARNFIHEHQDDDLTLAQVAHSVNTSAFYFCKMFKKSTGMTFTDYLARVRVEKVKNLLLNPHKRVSEAAFEAGFQSLSQFNRVFRKLEGCSPTNYRNQLHPMIPAR
ncbi:PocR ligand-binding domain-containing protein [Ereboglobus luteus]|uniref:AraC family transcriptional regulator n=1 Tax=Ereboglobus luteus TaxID=1796921 RepID=A0A2U8E1H3_9BACT|nr:PocR ligand-binding domain-containing protein [Ereboglobus luteus]AWI08707.1 AraC family transcriptional regulator [Ereboglobus luteus]